MSYIIKILVLDLIVIVVGFCACSNSNSSQALNAPKEDAKSQGQQTNHPVQVINASDDEIITLVDSFVGGDSKALDDAEKELSSYPRQNLVERLVNIRQGLLAGDRRLISLAFVLCVLDHDYETNKQVLVSDFNREPHQQNMNADWEAWLLNRLVRRGDKDLLPVLLEAIKWSDGGMSSALKGIAEEHLKDNTGNFLEALVTMDIKSRKDVYTLIDAEDYDPGDLSKIQGRLRSVKSDSETSAVANELLKRLNKRA